MVKKSKWQEHLTETFKEMKRKDKSVTFSEAMKQAAKTYSK